MCGTLDYLPPEMGVTIDLLSRLNTDWFPPADASLKRLVIQRLVYDLLHQPYDEPPSMAANKAIAVNFFREICNPSTNCHTSQPDNGIEISLLPSLSITNEPSDVDPTESSKHEFETGSFLGMQFPSLNETSRSSDSCGARAPSSLY